MLVDYKANTRSTGIAEPVRLQTSAPFDLVGPVTGHRADGGHWPACQTVAWTKFERA